MKSQNQLQQRVLLANKQRNQGQSSTSCSEFRENVTDVLSSSRRFVLSTKSSSTQSKLSAIISWKMIMWLIDWTTTKTKTHFKRKNQLGYLNSNMTECFLLTSAILVPMLSSCMVDRLPDVSSITKYTLLCRRELFKKLLNSFAAEYHVYIICTNHCNAC